MIITREMEKARERLEAYKAKIQPYPPYPSEQSEPEPVETKLVVFQVPSNAFLDIKGDVANLRKKLTDHIDKKKGSYTIK